MKSKDVTSLSLLNSALPALASSDSTVARSEEKLERKVGMTSSLRESRRLKSICFTLVWVGSDGSRYEHTR